MIVSYHQQSLKWIFFRKAVVAGGSSKCDQSRFSGFSMEKLHHLVLKGADNVTFLCSCAGDAYLILN